MESPLGPLFANYYKSFAENKIVPSFQDKHMLTYCRFVDDIFIIAKSYYVVVELRANFKENCVLKFKCKGKKTKTLLS